MVLFDALHLITYFANSGSDIKSATDEKASEMMDRISTSSDSYKRFARNDFDISRKGRALISEDLDQVALKLHVAFQTSDAKLLDEMAVEHGKTANGCSHLLVIPRFTDSKKC
jgi:hypothetical protein